MMSNISVWGAFKNYLDKMGWVVGQMSTFVYVRWVGGQSNVYVDIFQESLYIKIFIQGIKDRIVVFWVPQTNFHKTLQKKKYFKKIIFSEQNYVLVREVIFKMST